MWFLRHQNLWNHWILEVIWKINCKKQQPKIDHFLDKNIFLISNMVYSDRTELDHYDLTIIIHNSWTLPKLICCRNAHSFQTIRYRSQILIAQFEDLNKDCVNSSRPYLLYFLRNKLSNSITVWSDRTGPDRDGPVHRFKWFC